MINPWCHQGDCLFWFDLYSDECTCADPPPSSDPMWNPRTLQAEINALQARIRELEAELAAGKKR